MRLGHSTYIDLNLSHPSHYWYWYWTMAKVSVKHLNILAAMDRVPGCISRNSFVPPSTN